MIEEALMKGTIGKVAAVPMDATGKAVLPPEVYEIVKKHVSRVKYGTLAYAVPVVGEILGAGASMVNIWTMYKEINDALGIKFSDNILKSIAGGVAANLGAYFAVSVALSALGKFIPGGNIAGAVVDVAVTYAVTLVSGRIYLEVLSRMYAAGEAITGDGLSAAIKAFLKDNKADIKRMLFEQKKKGENKDDTTIDIGYVAPVVEEPEAVEETPEDKLALAEARLRLVNMLNVLLVRNQAEINKWLIAAEKSRAVGNIALAREQWHKAADFGSVEAMRLLGCSFWQDKDSQRALTWLLVASSKGDAEAMIVTGSIYEEIDKPEQAKSYYSAAANMGYIAAMRCLGYLYRTENNNAESMKWFKKAAEQGDAQSMNEMGACCWNNNEHAQAAQWYKKSAKAGYDWGVYNYAVCLEKGDGVEKNEAEAAEYYKMAAEQALPEAMNKLGLYYRRQKEETLAAQWFREAADFCYADGMYNYALCLEVGEGIEKNPAEAIKYYEQAANDGHIESMNKAGEYFLQTKEYEKAVAWFKTSADSGNDKGMYHYGRCLEKGHGVKKNTTEAIEYYKKAAALGNKEAEKAQHSSTIKRLLMVLLCAGALPMIADSLVAIGVVTILTIFMYRDDSAVKFDGLEKVLWILFSLLLLAQTVVFVGEDSIVSAVLWGLLTLVTFANIKDGDGFSVSLIGIMCVMFGIVAIPQLISWVMTLF